MANSTVGSTATGLGFSLPAGLAIGIATGVLSGLMGVGGGIIAVPAMVGAIGVSQHRAHGTSLAMMVLTATASAIIYTTRGQVNWPLALLLAVGTVSGAHVGARLMPRVPARHLRQFFGLFILLIGLNMVIGIAPTAQGQAVALPVEIVEGVLIGLVAGVLSGLLGIGGGVIMVPAMVFLLGTAQHVAQGVSLAVIVPTAITGAVTHYRHGNVVPRLAIVLGVGAVLGALAGAWVAGLLDPTWLRRGFGVFVVVVAARMLLGELRASRRSVW